MGLFDFSFGYSSNKSNTKSVLDKEDTAWLYQQQSDQWRANTEWYNDKGYSMLRSGLEKAGYNPLLALGAQPLNGATVQGSSMTTTGDTNAKSINGTLPISMNAYRAQLRNVNADTLLKGAQTDETLSRSSLENALDVLKRKEIPFADRKIAAETTGLELQNQYQESLIKYVEAQTGTEISRQKLVQAQTGYYKALQGLTRSQSRYYNKIIEQIDAGLELSAPMRQFLKDHPDQAQFLAGMKEYAGAIGPIVSPVINGVMSFAGARLGTGKVNATSDLIKSPGNLIDVSPIKIQY